MRPWLVSLRLEYGELGPAVAAPLAAPGCAAPDFGSPLALAQPLHGRPERLGLPMHVGGQADLAPRRLGQDATPLVQIREQAGQQILERDWLLFPLASESGRQARGQRGDRVLVHLTVHGYSSSWYCTVGTGYNRRVVVRSGATSPALAGHGLP